MTALSAIDPILSSAVAAIGIATSIVGFLSSRDRKGRYKKLVKVLKAFATDRGVSNNKDEVRANHLKLEDERFIRAMETSEAVIELLNTYALSRFLTTSGLSVILSALILPDIAGIENGFYDGDQLLDPILAIAAITTGVINFKDDFSFSDRQKKIYAEFRESMILIDKFIAEIIGNDILPILNDDIRYTIRALSRQK